MTSLHDDFIRAVMAHFEGPAAEDAGDNVRKYFYGPPRYTGSKFEVLADTDQPNRITAADIVAVSTLSVNIPAATAIWLLSGEGRIAVGDLLANVPTNVDMWDAPDLLAESGHLWRLWDLLGSACWPEPNQGNGMGVTKTSKVLAAKRPRLVPVFDRVVRVALPPVDSYWAAFTDLLADPDRRAAIEAATTPAPAHVSLLRRLDVALWMANHKP